MNNVNFEILEKDMNKQNILIKFFNDSMYIVKEISFPLNEDGEIDNDQLDLIIENQKNGIMNKFRLGFGNAIEPLQSVKIKPKKRGK